MKKIINGKVYDTEAAERVGSWDNGKSSNDFYRSEESLYRKRTGEFFLYGYGGANTKYAVSCGSNSWTGGKKIIPLDYESAQKWTGEHLSADKYEEIFGIVEEKSDEKIIMTFHLNVSTANKIRNNASKAGLSLSAYLETLVDNK